MVIAINTLFLRPVGLYYVTCC